MGSEHALTASLEQFFPRRPRDVPVGIGDDAAVVRTGARTVVACDPMVEGVHFERTAHLRRIGASAVRRNLSDLAAMGAAPDYALVSVLLPRWVDARRRRELFQGIRAAAQRADCLVVGGDCGRSPGPLAITVTVLGHLVGEPLLRSSLRVGDQLHVTGPLGGSLLGHHLRFAPRLAEGQWLAAKTDVRCAIDISDGLLLDLASLLRASAVPGAELDARAIPIRAAARQRAVVSGRRPLDHALTDGEDYELLFAVGSGRELPRGGPLSARARRSIGRASAEPGVRLRHRDGQLEPVVIVGFDHDV